MPNQQTLNRKAAKLRHYYLGPWPALGGSWAIALIVLGTGVLMDLHETNPSTLKGSLLNAVSFKLKTDGLVHPWSFRAPDLLAVAWLFLATRILQRGIVEEQAFMTEAERTYPDRKPTISMKETLSSSSGTLPIILLSSSATAAFIGTHGTHSFTWLRFLMMAAVLYYASFGVLGIWISLRQLREFFAKAPSDELLFHADLACGLSFMRRYGNHARLGIFSGTLVVPLAVSLFEEAVMSMIDKQPVFVFAHVWPIIHILAITSLTFAWVYFALCATFKDGLAIDAWLGDVQMKVFTEAATKKQLDDTGQFVPPAAKYLAREKAATALNASRFSLGKLAKHSAPLAVNILGTIGAFIHSDILETISNLLDQKP